MGEQEFYDTIKETVQRYFEEDGIQVYLEQILKNNNKKMTVLMMKKEKETLAPVIYLKRFYNQVQEGRTLEHVIEDIVEIYEEASRGIEYDTKSFFDFDLCKEQLFLRLVNIGMNSELWETTPFLPWNDLALTVRWLVGESENGISSILVTEKELERWGITFEEVLEYAKENTKRLFPAKVVSLRKFMTQSLKEQGALEEQEYLEQQGYLKEQRILGEQKYLEGQEYLERQWEVEEQEYLRKQKTLEEQELLEEEGLEEQDDSESMYILTNKIEVNGATVLCYPNLIWEFAKKMNFNVFILPSSIHEVILVPDRGNFYIEDLRDMVREANATVVAEEEILSYQLYYCDKNTGRIEIVIKSSEF